MSDIVVTSFKKDCTIYHLDEDMFYIELGEVLDSYIESGNYKNEFPDSLVLTSKDNIAQLIDTNTGKKFFIGIFPRKDLVLA